MERRRRRRQRKDDPPPRVNYDTNADDALLRRLYTDPSVDPSGALGSRRAFVESARRRLDLRRVSNARLRDILDSTEAYARHRWPRHAFPRRSVYATRVGELIQLDLDDLSDLGVARSSRFVLIACCTVSRYCILRALTNKSARACALQLESILSEIEDRDGHKVSVIFSDRGSEFRNKLVTNVVDKRKIRQLYSSGGTMWKCPLVENKGKMFKQRAYS